MLGSVLGIDIRTARAAWTVFLLALLIATAYTIRVTLVVFMVALLFAYMLSPLVNLVQSRLPKRVSPAIALVIVYVGFIGVLVGVGIFLGGRIVDEATTLGNRLPGFFQNPEWMKKIPLPAWLDPWRERIIQSIQAQFSTGGKDLMPYFQKALVSVLSSLNGVLFVVLVPILAFFFLKDGSQLRDEFIGGLTDPPQRKLVNDILNDVHVLLGQYIRALVLLAIATFTTYSLFLMITGAPYALLLAGTAGVLEFIPVVGPLAAGAIVMLVCGFSGYTHLLWFAIFWVVYRLFQDYMLSPHLMSSGVELHPLLVLFGVLAGERVAGIPGMFFSVPVIATLRVIYVRAQRARQRRQLTVSKIEV